MDVLGVVHLFSVMDVLAAVDLLNVIWSLVILDAGCWLLAGGCWLLDA